MMVRFPLLIAVILVSACNTMAGFGDDMMYYGSKLTGYAQQDESTGSGTGTSSQPLASSPPAPQPAAPTTLAPRTGASVFAEGEYVTFAKPARLHAQPSLDAAVIGYGQPGETYQVIAQQ